MKDNYIDKINYYHDILKVIRDYHEEPIAITEYDNVYSDILEYQDNDFESFENEKDFIEFIDYLKGLIIGGLE